MDWSDQHRIARWITAVPARLARLSKHVKKIHTENSRSLLNKERIRPYLRCLILALISLVLGHLAHEKTVRLENEKNRSTTFPKINTLETLIAKSGLKPLNVESSNARQVLDGLPRYNSVIGEVWVDSSSRAIAITYAKEKEIDRMVWTDPTLSKEKLTWANSGIGVGALEAAIIRIEARERRLPSTIQSFPKEFRDTRQLHY